MQTLDYLVVSLYLIMTLIIGFMPVWIRKKDKLYDLLKNGNLIGFIVLIAQLPFKKDDSQNLDEYHLGNFPWWALGASGMASNVDIAGTMLIAALVYALGTQGFFIEIRGGIVLIMAFLMIFMGKWTRRAVMVEDGEKKRVMTTAQWMVFRFGKGKGGDFARIISAVSNIIFSVGAMSYFSIGGGKFIGTLMGIDDRTASILLVLLSATYTVISGFSGVIWTDVFQGGLILVAVFYICGVAWTHVTLPATFSVSIPNGESYLIKDWNFADWSSILPPMTTDIPGDYSIFNLFGGVILFYLLKTVIEGCSGAGGYMAQRYFAARNEQDTAFLSLFWIISMSFRWPLIAAFAVLGIHYGLTHSTPITDPELILPTVINNYVPIGLKGLLVACFMAAAMSTFSSIINASAAYWSNDIYEPYIFKPRHPEFYSSSVSDEQKQDKDRHLFFHSQGASILIVLVGLLFSFNLSNINEIWGWLSLGLGVGLGIPLLLRWYWWQFNGYGFAWGTLAGMIAAIITKAAILPLTNNPQTQEYILFFLPAIASLLGCIIGTYVNLPQGKEQEEEYEKVVQNFHDITKPFGFWGKFGEGLSRENKADILATCMAVPWQLSLFLLGMMVMMKNWENMKILALLVFLLSIGLYFTWLKPILTKAKKRRNKIKKLQRILPNLLAETVDKNWSEYRNCSVKTDPELGLLDIYSQDKLILRLEVVSEIRGKQYENHQKAYAKEGILYYVLYQPLPMADEETCIEVYKLDENGKYKLIENKRLENTPIDLSELGLRMQPKVAKDQKINRVWLHWYDQEDNCYSSP